MAGYFMSPVKLDFLCFLFSHLSLILSTNIINGVKNFARRKSKCKGRDTRACQLVGGTGGRQTWLGRDLGWSELGQARNNPSLIFFEQEG